MGAVDGNETMQTTTLIEVTICNIKSDLPLKKKENSNTPPQSVLGTFKVLPRTNATCQPGVPVWLFLHYIFITRAPVCGQQKAR